MKRLAFLFFIGLLAGSCTSLHTFKIPKGELGTFFDYSTEQLPLVSAHRGGRYMDGYPENSIPTFKYVLRHTPALIECDVNLSKDSVLLLLHDETLERTTTARGPVMERDWKSLKKLRLLDDKRTQTKAKIPRLDKVLRWAKGKTILTLDIKKSVPLEKVIALVEKTKCEDYAVVITYSPEQALAVYRRNPSLLISASISSSDDLNQHLNAGIPAGNLLAFTGTKLPKPELNQKLRELGIPVLFGTFSTADGVRKPEARDVLYKT